MVKDETMMKSHQGKLPIPLPSSPGLVLSALHQDGQSKHVLSGRFSGIGYCVIRSCFCIQYTFKCKVEYLTQISFDTQKSVDKTAPLGSLKTCLSEVPGGVPGLCHSHTP